MKSKITGQINPNILLALVIILGSLSVGCSTQYWLERKIYQLNVEVLEKVPRIKEMPQGELSKIISQIDSLLSIAEKRKMALPLLKLKAIVYGARADYSDLDKLLNSSSDKVSIFILYALYKIGLRLKDDKLCLWTLDKVSSRLKGTTSYYSLPYLKCVALLNCKGSLELCKPALQYYEKLKNSGSIKKRFYGYEGLFLTYLVFNQKDKALEILDSMLKDQQLSVNLLFTALRQELSILLGSRQYDRAIKILREFLHSYGKELRPAVKERLEKLITDLVNKKDNNNPTSKAF